MNAKKIGLILTGGGAKGAYQAGALKGLCEIAMKLGIKNPFSILSGISVGAINSALFSSHAEDFSLASAKLVETWHKLRTSDIVRTGKMDLGKKAGRMLLELTSGKMIKHKKALSLLDNSPCFHFLKKEIDFSKVHENIKKGYIESLAVTAVNYSDGKNYIFFETNGEGSPWQRERRVVKRTEITLDHIVASSSIPLYFPPQKIDGHYYADGNIRNSTPLSPPIRLGAEKLIVIPVKEKENETEIKAERLSPTLGRMITVLLDALLYDAVDFDYERLSRINQTLNYVTDISDFPLRKIDVCIIRPSENLAQISKDFVHEMPAALRYFLEGLGPAEESAGLISTLLFEPSFTRSAMELGYRDALTMKEEIVQFLTN